jgi:hypothetical protein
MISLACQHKKGRRGGMLCKYFIATCRHHMHFQIGIICAIELYNAHDKVH